LARTAKPLSLLNDFDGLCALVDRHSAVSFDIFATLMIRSFADPASLHQWMEAKLAREDGRYAEFRWLRALAEKAAREAAQPSGFEEVTLAEIYDELERRFSDEGLAPLARAAELEVESEIAFSYAHPIGKRLVEYARDRGKKIVFAADTYLPRSAIDAMLRRAGYDAAFLGAEPTVFLSSDERLCLETGSLLRWIHRKLECAPGELLHIGRSSENKKTRALGISHANVMAPLEDVKQRLGFEDSRLYESDFAFQTASLSMFAEAVFDGAMDEVPADHAYWFLLGYNLVAPLMISLAYWARENAIRTGSEKVFFLSRDGLIVKRAYDELFRDDPQAPASDYLYASRRMLSVPFRTVTNRSLYLYYCDFIESSATVDDLFQRLPGTARWRELAEKNAIELTLPLAGNAANKKRLEQLVTRNADVIFDALAPERDLVREYLRSRVRGHRRIAVFDIGWWGSLQRAIEVALVDDDVHVAGLYFALLYGAKFRGDTGRTRGYLAEFGRPIAHEAVLDKGLSYFEVLFYGDHPGVQSVRRRGDGSYEPVFLEGPRERIRTARARTIHRAVELHVRRAMATFGRELEALYDRQDIVHVALLHADKPRRIDAENFVALNFDASLGDDEGSPIIDARVRSPQSYLAGVRRSHWKQGARAFHPAETAVTSAKKVYARGKLTWRRIRKRMRAVGRSL
jgi:predicted HAD superfamily hydrolase